MLLRNRFIADKFVHTIAKLEKNNRSLNRVLAIENIDSEAQHSQVYKQAISSFSEYTGITDDQIDIIKNDHGVPFLKAKKQKKIISLSLSHHGNYGAFAFNKI